MPALIRHRVNAAAALAEVPLHCGVEVDVRSNVTRGGALHIHHDPGTLGEDFTAWLHAYARRGLRGPLVLNTKEDGLEPAILAGVRQAGIDNFFFLDTTPPSLVGLLRAGEHAHACQRVSLFEPAAALHTYATANLPPPRWVWLDCFFTQPLDPAVLRDLPETTQVCLVSPELQGALVERIAAFAELGRHVHAVCTKRLDLWGDTG